MSYVHFPIIDTDVRLDDVAHAEGCQGLSAGRRISYEQRRRVLVVGKQKKHSETSLLVLNFDLAVETLAGMTKDSNSAVADETQAFLQLLQQKPPANLEGFLHLVGDMRRERFTVHEQRLMAESDSGQALAGALVRCEGLKQKANEAASLKGDNAREAVKESTIKYVDCLSYVSCPDRWKQYTQCWTKLSDMPVDDLKKLKEVGFEVACRNERHALESCVGNHVTRTVRASEDGFYATEVEDT